MGRAECDVMHKTADSNRGQPLLFYPKCPICPRFSDLSGLSGNGRFVRNVQIVREWSICPDCPKNHAIIILRASEIRIVSFPSAGITAQVSCYLCSMGHLRRPLQAPAAHIIVLRCPQWTPFSSAVRKPRAAFSYPRGLQKYPLPQKDLPPPGMTRRGKGSRSFEDHRTAHQQKEAAS